MKRFICLLGIIIAISSFNTSYCESQGNVYLDSNKDNIEISNEIEITVNLENAQTAAFTIYLYFDDDKFEYISGPENSNKVGNYVINVWYDLDGGKSPKQGMLQKFKFKAKKEGLATFNIQGQFYNEVGQLIDTNFKEKQIQIGTTNILPQTQIQEQEESEEQNYLSVDNANLEILAVQNALLNPPFDTNLTNYNVEISNKTTNLNIFAASENENAIVEIIGKDDLKEGDNLVKIIVTAQDGKTKKVYEINAYKRNAQEEENYIRQQEENKEKLEQIYEAQRTSNEKTDTTQKNKTKIIYVLITAIVIMGISVAIYYKKGKQNKN